MNYVPFAKNLSGKSDGIFKNLYLFPDEVLIAQLKRNFFGFILGVYFVMVWDQNTSCKILLEFFKCHKTFQKIIYLNVTLNVMLFFSLPSSMCLETRKC